ncbi:DMT family transporter [Pseudomonas sp. HR96]|uniref:DMT family transporter n=1 Tax=Pseudomonas sp. HR96 TaxID=1027966 RepID=UPI002A757235|nr:DMT family transporter [Pseudomonas sp. HR96]WPO98285.1 DMT family transporter [Pseudomonas sp. HR96]
MTISPDLTNASQSPPRRQRRPWHRAVPLPLLEAGLVLTWSSGFVGARFSLDYAPAFLAVFWRCVLVTLLLTPLAWAGLRRASPKALLHNAGIGLLAMAGYLCGVVGGIALGVPAGLAALVADLLPVGVALLSVVLLGQRLPGQAWAGLAIGSCGVLLVTHGALALGHAPLWAYGLPLLGMLSLAFATLWQQRLGEGAALGPAVNLWLQCGVSALAFAVVQSVQGGQGGLSPLPTAGFALSVLWTAALSTLGGYGLYWVCLARAGHTRVASVLFLSPGVTLLWGWCMFGEPLSWAMLAGTAVSAGGIWLVLRGQHG